VKGPPKSGKQKAKAAIFLSMRPGGNQLAPSGDRRNSASDLQLLIFSR
jgi:hypothetical protein